MVFLFFLPQKNPALQESRSTQQECRPGVWWLHQCAVVSIRCCGENTLTFPRMRRHLVPASAARTSGPCAKESCRTPPLMSTPEWRLRKCEPGRRRRPHVLGFCKSAHNEQWPHSLQALRFEHFYEVPAVPAHFASGHVDHVANLKPPRPLLFAVSGAADCERRREALPFRERLG